MQKFPRHMIWRSFFTVFLFGVLEGITEWLPVSSTGHLILLENVLALPLTDAGRELFEVLVQLGAMAAVVILFWRKLCPFGRGVSAAERRAVFVLWGKLAVAVLPAALLGFLLDELLTEHLYRPVVVAGALVAYGVLFLLPIGRGARPKTADGADLSWRTAFFVGCFQTLSLVPGTSRSGSTILGGLLLGLTRPAAAEFSFFLGVPTMLGAGVLKGGKLFLSGGTLPTEEWILITFGALVAFLVSLVAIRFLMDFVRRHSFVAFGIYRILLGVTVLAVAI